MNLMKATANKVRIIGNKVRIIRNKVRGTKWSKVVRLGQSTMYES